MSTHSALCRTHEQRQVDVRQLGSGRSPSILPFDTLLLPYPATPAWRRQIAEAHSRRYAEASVALAKPDEIHVDEDHTGGSEGERGQDGASGGDEASSSGSERTIGSSSRRALLNVGFIGHDFSEHPTAHMMEGVFAWQRKLTDIEHERTTISEALETGAQSSSGNWTAIHWSAPKTAAICCR